MDRASKRFRDCVVGAGMVEVVDGGSGAGWGILAKEVELLVTFSFLRAIISPATLSTGDADDTRVSVLRTVISSPLS